VWNGSEQLLSIREIAMPIATPYPKKFELVLREKQWDDSEITEIEPMSK